MAVKSKVTALLKKVTKNFWRVPDCFLRKTVFFMARDLWHSISVRKNEDKICSNF